MEKCFEMLNNDMVKNKSGSESGVQKVFKDWQ